MSPVGAIFVPFPTKTGTNLLHPLPAPIVELVEKYFLSAFKTTVYKRNNEQ